LIDRSGQAKERRPDTMGPWSIEVFLPARLDAHRAMAAFERHSHECGIACSIFSEGDGWRVQVLTDRSPGPEAVYAIEQACAELGLQAPPVRKRRLPARDWLTFSNRLRRPVRTRRFFLSGRSDRALAPASAWRLLIEAGRAFGTGQAPSTFGCLLAIERLIGQRPRSALDVGTGSGVLAMALARAGKMQVMALDTDPVAVEVARANVRQNGLQRFVRVLKADVRHRLASSLAPYDAVTANLTPETLRRSAAKLVRLLAPGGRIVLSGFLRDDARSVLNAYRARGLKICRRIQQEGWTTLVLRRCRKQAL
jgi:ribosomal protein L11 methyltransferase